MSEEQLDVKKPWQSKTIWMSVLMAVAPLYPPLGAVMAAHTEIVSAVLGAVFAGLRLVSDSKVKVK